jgi:hypothetical protein
MVTGQIRNCLSASQYFDAIKAATPKQLKRIFLVNNRKGVLPRSIKPLHIQSVICVRK